MNKYNDNFNATEGLELFKYLSYSLTRLFQGNICPENMVDWKKASTLFYLFCIKNNSERTFPLTINNQIEFLSKPINEWGVGFFEEFDGVDTPLIVMGESEWELTELAIELANDYDKNPGAKDLVNIQKAVRDAGLDDNIYTKFRELLIRNPVVSEYDFMNLEKEFIGLVKPEAEFALESIVGSADLFKIFKDQYDEIEFEGSSKKELNICPYCGYTLLAKTKFNVLGKKFIEYHCISSKCLRRKNVRFKTVIKVGQYDRYYRLYKPIMNSVVLPGILEIRLYDELITIGKKLNFQVLLYPGADKADIIIRFNDGVLWAIDAKDWVKATGLAHNLNIKGFMKGVFSDLSFNISEGILVLPDDASDAYINQIKAKWDKADLYEILKYSELIEKVQERCFN